MGAPVLVLAHVGGLSAASWGVESLAAHGDLALQGDLSERDSFPRVVACVVEGAPGLALPAPASVSATAALGKVLVVIAACLLLLGHVFRETLRLARSVGVGALHAEVGVYPDVVEGLVHLPLDLCMRAFFWAFWLRRELERHLNLWMTFVTIRGVWSSGPMLTKAVCQA